MVVNQAIIIMVVRLVMLDLVGGAGAGMLVAVPGLVAAVHRAAAHAVRGEIRAGHRRAGHRRAGRHGVSPITLNNLALVNYLHFKGPMSSSESRLSAETGG
jgi:hypothetical protein